MPTITEIADEILTREGGYVDDPDDPGGATKHGVTIGTLRRLGMDLTGDGRVTRADVRGLTKEQARSIFLKNYYYAPQIHTLPEMLHASVFDMQVNAGANAVKILQRLFSKMDFPVKDDGKIGPLTQDAARRAAMAAPDHLTDAYGIERRNYYYALADRRPASRKYARRRDGGKWGWITRAEEFIAPRYHLSDDDHRQRITAWE